MAPKLSVEVGAGSSNAPLDTQSAAATSEVEVKQVEGQSEEDSSEETSESELDLMNFGKDDMKGMLGGMMKHIMKSSSKTEKSVKSIEKSVKSESMELKLEMATKT